MTEEIKEILEYLKDDKKISFGSFGTEYKRVELNDVKLLLNYITNLQKENQSLKEKLNCKEYFSSTMPENTEFVILTKENYDRQQKDLALENIILKSRNEKAIEYIENNKDKVITTYGDDYDYETCLFKEDIDDLLNILQGGDE